MQRVRMSMQHHLNPLHVYCRLCGTSLGRKNSMRLCRLYGRLYALALSLPSVLGGVLKFVLINAIFAYFMLRYMG